MNATLPPTCGIISPQTLSATFNRKDRERHAHDCPSHHLEYLHDLRLVRTPQVPRRPTLQSYGRELVDRLLEYCFQVPANRIGSYEFTAAQLKTIQEVITLTVFAVFSVLYLKQPLRWNYLAGFVLIVAAVAVIFRKW